MRLTYQDIRAEHYRAINLVNSDGTPKTDINIDNNFNYHLGQRYQEALAKMVNYKSEIYEDSFETVPGQQYYSFPVGAIRFEGIYVNVNSIKFPLTIITSLLEWQKRNTVMISAGIRPQFYFPRQTDFGIWPIPQDVYTGVASYYYRDRNLSVPDYTEGSVSLSGTGSTTVTGTSTNFTAAMTGRWFTVTDTSTPGQGYWYRVASVTDSTHLELNTDWDASTVSGVSYRIGETPELPEEMHQIFAFGTAASYYGTMQKDKDAFAWNNNMFYTGDPLNSSRSYEDKKITGGLIGGVNSYSNRDNRTIIRRGQPLNAAYIPWGTRLS